MANAKDIIMGVGVAAAVAMGGASLVRGAPASPRPSASAPGQVPGAPPSPPPCADACQSLAKWCAFGSTINCAALLGERVRSTADSGQPFVCNDHLSASDVTPWCNDGGVAVPLFGGAR